MSGQDSAGETGGEEEEEKEVVGETKARDDLEDCDVADSQLTCSPSLPHCPGEWWSGGVRGPGLERSGHIYYHGDYSLRRRRGVCGNS